MTVTTDSRLYNMTFYGILNANGAFWTPLAFDSEAKAEQHIRNFWLPAEREWEGLRSKFTIVPVRIQLTALDPRAMGRAPGRAETAQQAQGFSPPARSSRSEDAPE